MKRLIITLALLLFTTAVFAASVQVSWNANSEVDLAGYNVYYGTAPGTYGEAVDIGNETAYVLELTPDIGTTYYFTVTAYDTSENESGLSEEVSAFIPDGIAPAPPTGIKAIIQAIISWLRSFWGLTVRVV